MNEENIIKCPNCKAPIVAIEELVSHQPSIEDGQIYCTNAETQELKFYCENGCSGDIEELPEYHDFNINFN